MCVPTFLRGSACSAKPEIVNTDSVLETITQTFDVVGMARPTLQKGDHRLCPCDQEEFDCGVNELTTGVGKKALTTSTT